MLSAGPCRGILRLFLVHWTKNFATQISFEWCGWRDLNPHASRRQNLNLVRLPISPHPHQ